MLPSQCLLSLRFDLVHAVRHSLATYHWDLLTLGMDFDHDVICVQVAAVVCRQKQPFPRSETAAYGSLLHGSHYHLQPRLQLHFVCVGLILIFFNGDEFISHLYVVDLILLLILRVFYQTSMLPSSTSIFSFFCPKVSNCY